MTNRYMAHRNQLANTNNMYQGDAKKVLCVCSAGMLRSPTMANVLHMTFGYNTRACGSAMNFALIPITEALIYWADEMVFSDQDAFDELINEAKEDIEETSTPCIILDIPDNYDYDNEDLKDIILFNYSSKPRT